MQSTTLTTLVTRLNAHKGNWPRVSEASGVPISTLRKIAQGVIQSPGIVTVDKLFSALDAMPTLASHHDGAPPVEQQQ